MEPRKSEPRRVEEQPVEGTLTRRDDQAMPAVLDPAATMELVQRYVESERHRNRRVLVWMSTGFLFVILLLFTTFVSIGVIVLGSSRRAAEKVENMRADTEAYSLQVAGMASKIGNLENGHEQIRQTVEKRESKRAKEDEILKSDLERFSDWVVAGNEKKAKTVARLEARVKEMEEIIASKDKELREIKTMFASLPAPGGGREAKIEKAPAPLPDAVVERLADIPAADETAGRDIVGEALDASAVRRSGPRGEMSVVKFPNGDRYEGEFRDGLLDGWGTYYYRNGDWYEGDFKNDVKHGKGTFTYRNGDKYIGDFKDDVKNGKGSFMFRDGDRYAGEFRNDVMGGKGSMLYKNGNRYVGDFRSGLKNGNGTFNFSNGDTYRGEFKNDLRNGRGIYTFSDGTKYIGEFKDGQKHGSGRYIYVGGEEYVGEFKEGKKDGKGVCVYPNGKRLNGLWKNDKFVRTLEASEPND